MATELLRDLDEKRKRALHQAREIAERAAAGDERAEDEEAYKRANADFDRYSAMMRDERKRLDTEAEDRAAADKAARDAGYGEHEAEPKPSDWLADLRAALDGKEIRRGGVSQRLPEPSRVPAIRAAMYPEARTSTLTTGANTVPVTLAESLFRKLFDDSAILSAGVRILRTATGEQIKFPRLTALGALSQANSRVSEGGTIIKTADPTFDQVVLDSYKYAQIMQSSRELMRDSVIDVEALLGELLGRNMANYLGYDLTLGDGSGKPKGIVTAIPAGNKVTGPTTATQGTGAITGLTNNVDDFYTLIWKLKPTYRRNAKWIVNDSTVLSLRKLRVNNEMNNYAFQPAGQAGELDSFLGYPLLIDPNIAAVGVGNLSMVFADPSIFWVRLVGDIRVEWSTEYAWDTDLVSVKAVLSADSDTIDDTGLAGFVGAAS